MDQTSYTSQEIVQNALEKWHELTKTQSHSNFSTGNFELNNINESLNESYTLDPTGTTTILMLEFFLRKHLEQKTFTVASMMQNYDKVTKYLSQAQSLFSILQSDDATEISAHFKARVLAGVTHYDANTNEVTALIDDANAMPFLRRDALNSLNSLKSYQFLSGDYSAQPAQIIEHVYQTWDINELLASLRDMPVSGIAVVLIRDPIHTERSYFAFAMRNGGNVTLLTDKSKPVYPGQEDNLRSRGQGRSFETRTWQNHFPYQLIKTSTDERGDIVFDKETSLVMEGKSLVPLMKIKSLPAHQVVWLTMMLSLISDKFWKKEWKSDTLSYTGAMIEKKNLLVTDTEGQNLPATQTYTPIALDEVTLCDISLDKVQDQFEFVPTGKNQWLEDRYGPSVTKDILNRWAGDSDTSYILPRTLTDDNPNKQNLLKGEEISKGLYLVSTSKGGRSAHMPGYGLKTFNPSDFGTQEELEKDRIWISRYNLSQHIQKSADDEYIKRKAEIQKWYFSKLEDNLPNLLKRCAIVAHKQSKGEDHEDSLLTFDTVDSAEFLYSFTNDNRFGGYNLACTKATCFLTDTLASYRGVFFPKTAQDIATLCNINVEDLPDVLQHWERDTPTRGNGILDRLDPVDDRVKDPWKKFPLIVNIYLSKRSLSRLQKEHIKK
jgi:hypothetical protein